jgi:hypothetical protein
MFRSAATQKRWLPLAILWAPAVWIGLTWVGVGSQAVRGAEDDLREVIVRLAKGYQLFMGTDRVPLEMQPEPVLRWPNSTRDTHDGATFVWTVNGRPEAIGCIWENNRILSHAFHSLSASKLVAEYGGRTIWRPDKAGIDLRSVPDAPQPADSAAKRLAQMKQLAHRITCQLTGGKGKGEELRLLPRPLYRYQTERKDLFDGALFAYVQGTDPEVILTLEAARHDGKAEWRYAITRRSMAALDADLDGKRIWEVPSSAGSAGDVWFHGGAAPVN